MDAQRGIARRMLVGLPPDGLTAAWERDFSAFPPAGVIVFARDFRDLDGLRTLTRRLRDLARPRRLFITMDEEGGFVSQLSAHLVVPPTALLLARGATPGDLERVARITGERLRALGVDWNLAPVADVHSEPTNPVIGPRAFGDDPAAVGRAVGETVRGFRAAGVASCLKHFPGHGDTLLDSHHALPRGPADRDRLESRELKPFRDNLDADSIMTAHVVYPALDPESPATFSKAIVHGLLREGLGYGGVIVTDALEMKGASAGRDPAEPARLALEAGCDLLLFAFHDEEVRRVRLDLARRLVGGELDRANFDAARTRLGSLDRNCPPPDDETLSRPLESLTPPDWVSGLEAIIERGLEVRGHVPAGATAGPWRVTEPPFAAGASLAADLGAVGVPLDDCSASAFEVVAVTTRHALPAEEIERLRARCRERPVALVGLQNDAFLEHLPEAALRISAADATPLTRRVVARALAKALRRAAEARV
ncbi:MAG TPA: glycoside hydrolase family 3 N-terminal domain-containing protein [Candidatus Eisenbacteria bacterium]|jgi:beta-N-acetylhexosaminidase